MTKIRILKKNQTISMDFFYCEWHSSEMGVTCAIRMGSKVPTGIGHPIRLDDKAVRSGQSRQSLPNPSLKGVTDQPKFFLNSSVFPREGLVL